MAIGLVLLVLSVYTLVYPEPRNWYNHYLFLANSILEGKITVFGMPEFYHDAVRIGSQTFLPFPPLPAVILIPFLFISSDITQQSVSVLLGALSVGLLYILLNRYTNKARTALLLAIVFGFGTVHFWSSVVGTTWYFAHTVGILFLILALLAHKKSLPLLAGILLACATLARLPIIMTSIFFLLNIERNPARVLFVMGVSFAVFTMLGYNYLRFGDAMVSGYTQVYEYYIHSGIPYTFMHANDASFPHFNYMDARSIPYHLYTFSLFPPNIVNGILQPSPYGMGIIFTSPLLLLAFIPPFKTKQERELLLGSLATAIIVFMHYAQGWVQFGYRFVLDFLPLLFILIAIKGYPKIILIILGIISVMVTSWGVHQAIELGW